jgi:phosphopantetheinyl transferase
MEPSMNMQLADHVEIFPQCRLWLAYFGGEADESILTTADDIAEAKISTQDLHRWQQFRPAAKKRQFLNSRLAIRAVLEKEFGKDADDVLLSSSVFGCPILQSREKEHVAHISLSHSENAVAVLISDGENPVGVDIEVSDPLRTNALRFVALHPHEQVWCDSHAGLESEALTTLWTIKESAWKTMRSEYNIALSDISVQFECGIPTPVISMCPSETLQFRTQVFAQHRSSVVAGAICLSTANVPLLGSVTQRTTTSAGADRSRQEYLRQI